MKTFIGCICGLAGFFLMLGCANGKKVHEKSPVAFQQAFYTFAEAGTKENSSGVVLYVPTEAGNQREVVLDSVYFRGKATQLVSQPDNPTLYVGYFEAPEDRDRSNDFVMSSDPKEEYGNKPPAILRNFPFDLEQDEAMVSYKSNGKTGYYKISGIVKKDRENTRIKYPDNVQH